MATKKAAALLALAGSASAQIVNNATMTEPYRQLYYNNPIGGILSAYTRVWGPWFYIILILGPYTSMYLYQGRRLGIANLWLVSTLVGYEYLIAGMTQDFVFYICLIIGVTSNLYRLVSPYNPER